MCARECVCMIKCERVCVRTCVRACVHACVRACVHTCMCACVRVCTVDYTSMVDASLNSAEVGDGHIIHIQYASIKSLRSTIVERSFYGASVCVSFQTQRCENGSGTEQSQERNGAKTVINYARNSATRWTEKSGRSQV